MAKPSTARRARVAATTASTQDYLAAIYDLAAKGDVVGIRGRAQALIALDPKHAPFAQSVLDLAARFKMKAIRQFVARYMNPTSPHA